MAPQLPLSELLPPGPPDARPLLHYGSAIMVRVFAWFDSRLGPTADPAYVYIEDASSEPEGFQKGRFYFLDRQTAIQTDIQTERQPGRPADR